MSRRILTRVLALSTVAALAACSSDDTTAPGATVSDAQVSADIAAASGSAIAQDVALMAGDMVQAGAASAQSMNLVAGGAPAMGVGANCTWDAGTKNWTCAHATESAWDVSRTLTFFSGGQAVQDYSASATDSLRVQLSASGIFSGVVNGRTRDDTLSHTRDVMVTGLTGANTTRTVSGTGHWDGHGTFTSERVTRRYTQSVANSFDHIVFPVGGGYPQSGTLTHDVTATMTVTGARDAQRSVSRHVVVTFNGSAAVPMTVGTLSCTLHLDTRAVSCS